MGTEERISEVEDRIVEITAEEQNKEKRMKRIEDNRRDFWDNNKCTNIRITRGPEEDEKKKGTEKIFLFLFLFFFWDLYNSNVGAFNVEIGRAHV